MTTRTSYDFYDAKLSISEWGGYSPRNSDEFGASEQTKEETWKTIIAGKNMALEYPVGAVAKTILTTRLGYSLFAQILGGLDKITGIKVWKKFSETAYRLVVASAGQLYEAQFTTLGTVVQTLTAISGGTCSLTNRVRMVQLNSLLYIVDGTSAGLRAYNGTTVTTITDGMLTADTPYPSLIFVHKNRLWINSMKTGQRNQVWWSNLGNGSLWTVPTGGGTDDAGTQTFRGFPDESSPITAFGVYRDSFVVHQAGRIYLFLTTGAPYVTTAPYDPTWQVKELSIDRGALSQDNVADLGEKIIYRTTRGVHELSGIEALQTSTTTIDTFNAKPVSYDIEPLLFSLDASTEACVFYKFYYILTLKELNGISNDPALVYDTRRKCWFTPWDNFKFSCYDVVNINGEDICFAGSDIDGKVYTLFTSATDAGTLIESNFTTKAFDFEKPDHTKTFRRCAFNPATTANGGVYVSYKIDYGPTRHLTPAFTGRSLSTTPLGTFILGTSLLGGAVMTKLVQRFFSVGRRGRHCSITFSNNNLYNTGSKLPFGIEMLSFRAYVEDEDQRNYA